MATTSTVSMVFDDKSCTIGTAAAGGYTLRDEAGNQVTLSLRAVVRCMAVAEHEKKIPALPGEFWQHVEQLK